MTVHSLRARPSRARWLRPVLLYPLLVITLAIFAIPLYWLFSTALKAPDEIYTYPVTWLPLGLHVENFVEAWRRHRSAGS